MVNTFKIHFLHISAVESSVRQIISRDNATSSCMGGWLVSWRAFSSWMGIVRTEGRTNGVLGVLFHSVIPPSLLPSFLPSFLPSDPYFSPFLLPSLLSFLYSNVDRK